MQHTNMPLISVIIPTYNRAHCLERAVFSVLKQTYTNIEVVIVDDGSIDETESLVASWTDSRICYIKQTNKGASAARNNGVANAKGDFIAFHDSDDEWVENKIEKQLEYWQNHPECGLIYSAYEMLLPYNIRHIVPNMEDGNKLEGNIFANLLLRNTIGAPTVMLRKSVFQEVGGFDESMRSLEDWDFALKVAKKYSIGFVPEVLLNVTSSAGGVSSNLGAYYQNRCYMLRKYRADYLATGMFERTVQDILEKAKRDNLIAQVEKMMMLYLSK